MLLISIQNIFFYFLLLHIIVRHFFLSTKHKISLHLSVEGVLNKILIWDVMWYILKHPWMLNYMHNIRINVIDEMAFWILGSVCFNFNWPLSHCLLLHVENINLQTMYHLRRALLTFEMIFLKHFICPFQFDGNPEVNFFNSWTVAGFK